MDRVFASYGRGDDSTTRIRRPMVKRRGYAEVTDGHAIADMALTELFAAKSVVG